MADSEQSPDQHQLPSEEEIQRAERMMDDSGKINEQGSTNPNWLKRARNWLASKPTDEELLQDWKATEQTIKSLRSLDDFWSIFEKTNPNDADPRLVQAVQGYFQSLMQGLQSLSPHAHRELDPHQEHLTAEQLERLREPHKAISNLSPSANVDQILNIMERAGPALDDISQGFQNQDAVNKIKSKAKKVEKRAKGKHLTERAEQTSNAKAAQAARGLMAGGGPKDDNEGAWAILGDVFSAFSTPLGFLAHGAYFHTKYYAPKMVIGGAKQGFRLTKKLSGLASEGAQKATEYLRSRVHQTKEAVSSRINLRNTQAQKQSESQPNRPSEKTLIERKRDITDFVRSLRSMPHSLKNRIGDPLEKVYQDLGDDNQQQNRSQGWLEIQREKFWTHKALPRIPWTGKGRDPKNWKLDNCPPLDRDPTQDSRAALLDQIVHMTSQDPTKAPKDPHEKLRFITDRIRQLSNLERTAQHLAACAHNAQKILVVRDNRQDKTDLDPNEQRMLRSLTQFYTLTSPEGKVKHLSIEELTHKIKQCWERMAPEDREMFAQIQVNNQVPEHMKGRPLDRDQERVKAMAPTKESSFVPRFQDRESSRWASAATSTILTRIRNLSRKEGIDPQGYNNTGAFNPKQATEAFQRAWASSTQTQKQNFSEGQRPTL